MPVVAMAHVHLLSARVGCRATLCCRWHWHNNVELDTRVTGYKFVVKDFGTCTMEQMGLCADTGEVLHLDDLLKNEAGWAGVLRNFDLFLI